eukprot:gene31206-41580_t
MNDNGDLLYATFRWFSVNLWMSSYGGMVDRSSPTHPTAGADSNIRRPTASRSSFVTASIFAHTTEGASLLPYAAN